MGQVSAGLPVNPPDAQHDLITQNLYLAFVPRLREKPGRGEVSRRQPVKVNDRRGYQPDFAWYPPERCAPPGEPRSFSGLPELIVEVLSPSTRAYDLVRKRADYEHIGIGEVWLVEANGEGMFACQRPEPGVPFTHRELQPDDTVTSPLLDGFELSVAALFER
jgi:Uma2 family endonuclease